MRSIHRGDSVRVSAALAEPETIPTGPTRTGGDLRPLPLPEVFAFLGSGSLLVPFLVCVFPLKAARIVGTDVFHAAILVTVTALAHAQGGTVDWGLAVQLLAGSLPGVALGSWVAPRTPARVLRGAVAALLLLTGFSLV